MSYDLQGMMLPAVEAAADLSNYQFHAVKLDASGDIALCSSAGEKAIGILQNKPEAAGRAASVMFSGVSKGVAGGTVVPNDPVGPDASGHLIKLDEEDEAVLGRCMVGASVGEIFPLTITHEGSAASVSDVHALVASANYSATGQNLMMKVHNVAGQFVKCSVAGENVLGVLTNAPALSATGLIKTYGPATITAGAGGVAAGDKLATDVNGKCVTATAGDVIVGYALAAILADATGAAFLMPSLSQSVLGTALANTKVWIGTAGGVAAEFALSGDVTMTAGGAVTIANDAVSAAKMGSTGTGVIFKGAAPDAVTELALTQGLIPIGDAADVTTVDLSGTAGDIIVSNGTTGVVVPVTGVIAIDGAGLTTVANDSIGVAAMSTAGAGVIYKGAAADAVTELALTEGLLPVGIAGPDVGTIDMGATAGNIMVDSGTAPASVPVSGDATLAAGGAVRLAKGFIRQLTTTWVSGEIVAGNITPLVLADFSALLAAGLVAAGDALIFHGVIANLYGGVAYDQNENSIIKYQTAGGGAAVSTTLANYFNAGADGEITTIKPITTDITPEINEDLVWTMSASPFAAAGTRGLSATLYYSVFTPAT